MCYASDHNYIQRKCYPATAYLLYSPQILPEQNMDIIKMSFLIHDVRIATVTLLPLIFARRHFVSTHRT